ncbi:MAG: hypothetical protein WCA32_12950 [Chromatiaceae bacterium]
MKSSSRVNRARGRAPRLRVAHAGFAAGLGREARDPTMMVVIALTAAGLPPARCGHFSRASARFPGFLPGRAILYGFARGSGH